MTALSKSQVLSHDLKTHCLVEFDTRLRRLISGKKLNPFLILLRPDSTVCDRTFQSPTNRDAPRTEKRITYNQMDSVPMKRLTYCNSCNGPKKGQGSCARGRAYGYTGNVFVQDVFVDTVEN